MIGWLRDFRCGLRGLWRSPGLTAVAAGSFAVAMTTSVIVFGVGNAILFRPLPVPDADRLVRIGVSSGNSQFAPVSLAEIETIRARSQTLTTVVATRWNTTAVNYDGNPVETGIEVVSDEYFTELKVPMILGRGFDTTDRATPTVVVSFDVWNVRFGRDKNVLGRAVSINGLPFSIVGVTDRQFRGTMPGFQVGLWVSLQFYETALPADGSPNDPNTRSLMAIARMTDSASVSKVQAELATIPSPPLSSDDAPRRFVVSGSAGVLPDMARLARPAFIILLGVTGLVLIAAGANVTILMLARTHRHSTELAVRKALGATELHIIRDVALETVLLAAISGIMALGISFGLSRWFNELSFGVGVPVAINPTVDWRVIGFTSAATLVLGIACGWLPTLHARRVPLTFAIKERSSTGSRHKGRIWDVFVVVQVCISTALLIITALMVRSTYASKAIDPGFDRQNLFLVSADPSTLYETPEGLTNFWHENAREANADPRIQKATVGLFVPLGPRSDRLPVSFPDGEERIHYNVVSPGYFEFMSVAIVAGRGFTDNDTRADSRVAVASRQFADRMGGPAEAIGQIFQVHERDGSTTAVTMVGVHEDFKYRHVGEAPLPIVHFPTTQRIRSDMLLHIRTGQAPALSSLQARLRSALPDSPVTVTPIEDVTRVTAVALRVATMLVAAAGFIALVLTLAGLFAVVAFKTMQRTREFGIRRAVGATQARVLGLVMRSVVKLVGVGFFLGLGSAAVTGGVLRSLLVGVTPTDPIAISAVAALMTLVSLAATYFPSRRALTLQLSEVLRSE